MSELPIKQNSTVSSSSPSSCVTPPILENMRNHCSPCTGKVGSSNNRCVMFVLLVAKNEKETRRYLLPEICYSATYTRVIQVCPLICTLKQRSVVLPHLANAGCRRSSVINKILGRKKARKLGGHSDARPVCYPTLRKEGQRMKRGKERGENTDDTTSSTGAH